ncbi:MAG: HYR domain-containing protein, partial [Bacteroidota bacterium]
STHLYQITGPYVIRTEDANLIDYFVAGIASIDGITRRVLYKFRSVEELNGGMETLSISSPELLWTKYLDQEETEYSGGWAAIYQPQEDTCPVLAYVDGRKGNQNGLGGFDVLIGSFDLDFNSCITKNVTHGMSEIDIRLNATNPTLTELPIPPFKEGKVHDESPYEKIEFCEPPILACEDNNPCTGDTTPPIFTSCPSDTTIIIESCLEPVCIQYFYEVVATDNCDENVTVTCDVPANSCFPLNETTTVTCTATDAAGNSSSCQFNVTIRQRRVVPFQLQCPDDRDILVIANDDNDCMAVVPNLMNNVTALGSCPIILVGQTPPAGTLVSENTTVTVTKGTGSATSSCDFNLIVEKDCTPASRNCGEAVITCFPGFNSNDIGDGIDENAPVLGIVDIRDQSNALRGAVWEEQSGSNIYHPTPSNESDPSKHWTYKNMGLVFGLAIDGEDNIYTTATTVYGCSFNESGDSPFGPAGAAGIYKVTPDDVVHQFITTGPFVSGGTQIPNNGSGLGNICYDKDHNQLFVTNFHDGMIYRIDLETETIMDRFDPFTGDESRSDDNPDFIALGERVWGIGYYKNRVYFGRWIEDRGRPMLESFNEVWSTTINSSTGNFEAVCTNGTCSGTDIREFNLPDQIDIQGEVFNYSNPVSDISFSASGK